jgi:hypothetical protein
MRRRWRRWPAFFPAVIAFTAGKAGTKVVAAFPTIESARIAADSLGVALIPANRISLIPAEEGIAGQWPAAYSYAERRYVSSTVSSGAILGAIAGEVGALVLAGLVASMANAELSAVVLLAVGAFWRRWRRGTRAYERLNSRSAGEQPAFRRKLAQEQRGMRDRRAARVSHRDSPGKGPLELYRGEDGLI